MARLMVLGYRPGRLWDALGAVGAWVSPLPGSSPGMRRWV